MGKPHKRQYKYFPSPQLFKGRHTQQVPGLVGTAKRLPGAAFPGQTNARASDSSFPTGLLARVNEISGLRVLRPMHHGLAARLPVQPLGGRADTAGCPLLSLLRRPTSAKGRTHVCGGYRVKRQVVTKR